MSAEQSEECIISNPAEQSIQSENIVLAKFEALTSQNMCSSQSADDPLGEQVLGYLEVQPSELGVDQNTTIFLQPQEIEIDGQHLILTQEGEGGSEIIVVVSTDQDNPSEHTVAQLTQSAIVNSSAVSIQDVHRTHTLVMEGAHSASHVELIGSDLVGSSADAEESRNLAHICVDRSHLARLTVESDDPHCSHVPENDSVEITSSSSSWNIPNCKLQENDDSTEMLFIPTPSALSSGSLTTSVLLSSSDPSTKHRNLMHLACIAQELQSASNKNDECDEPSGSDETQQIINSSVLENSANLKQQDQDISSSSYVSAEASQSSKTFQFDDNPIAASSIVQLSSNDTSVIDVQVSNTSISEVSPGSPDTSSETTNQHLSVFQVTSSSSVNSECSDAAAELPENNVILKKPESDGSVSEASISETKITSNSIGESVLFGKNEENVTGKTSSDKCVDVSDSEIVTIDNVSSPYRDRVEDQTKDLDINFSNVSCTQKASITVLNDSFETIDISCDLSDSDDICEDKDYKKSSAVEQLSFEMENSNPRRLLASEFQYSNNISSSGNSNDMHSMSVAMEVEQSSPNTSRHSEGNSKIASDVVIDISEESEIPMGDFSDLSENLKSTGGNISSKFSIISEKKLSDINAASNLPIVSTGLSYHQTDNQPTKTSSEVGMKKNSPIDENLDEEIAGVVNILSTAAEVWGHSINSGDQVIEGFTDGKENIQFIDSNVFFPHSTSKEDKVNENIEMVKKGKEKTPPKKLDEYNFEEDDEIEIIPLSTKSKQEQSKKFHNDSDIEVIEVSKMFKCTNDGQGESISISTSDCKTVRSNCNKGNGNIPVRSTASFTKEVSKTIPTIIRISAESNQINLKTEPCVDIADLSLEDSKDVEDKPAEKELLADETSGNLQEISVLSESSTHSVIDSFDCTEKISTDNSDVEIIEVQIEPPKKTYTRQSKTKILINQSEESVKKPGNGSIGEIELFSCDDLDESADRDFIKEPTLPFDICKKSNRKQNLKSQKSNSSFSSNDKGSIPLIQKKRKIADDSKRSLRPRLMPQEEKEGLISSTPNKRNADVAGLKQMKKKKIKSEMVNNEKGTENDMETAVSSSLEENNVQPIEDAPEAVESLLVMNNDLLGSTLTPVKRARHKGTKSKLNSNMSWEKLVKSPPGKVKVSSFLSNIRRRKFKVTSMKDTKPLSSHSFCTSPPKRNKHRHNFSETSLPISLETQDSFITPFKPLDIRIRCQSSPKVLDKSTTYQCSNCKFRTNRLANLIQHYKDRCLSEGSDIFEWRIHDMDRRQRIRGEELSDCNLSETMPNDSACGYSKNLSSDDHDFSKRTGSYSESGSEDELSTELKETTKKLGFKEDDIVWAEWKNIFWPSLVRHIYPKEKRVSVFLVGSPANKNGIKISVKKIRPFDNAEQNKKLLGEGDVYPDQEVFVKAVQKAEFFIRKKLLGVNLNSSQFFDNLDDDSIAYISDGESSVSSHSENYNISAANENFNEPTSSSNYQSNSHDDKNSKIMQVSSAAEERQENCDAEIAKVVECIKENKVDDYLLGILNNTIFSERHKKFNSSDLTEKDKLKWESWFGPVKDENQQEDVSDYCMRLLRSRGHCSESFDHYSYVFEVWVPEAIIKAVSCLRDVSLAEAEEFFTKDKKVIVQDNTSHLNIPSSEENQECRDRLMTRMKDASVSEEIAHALAI